MNRKERRRLGATGAYPRGRMNQHDEGELRMAVTETPEGKVRIDFGRAVTWIGMTKNEARGLAGLLMQAAGAPQGDN